MYYESDPVQSIDRIISENAVVIFSTATCYICHAVKRLFRGMGVSATVYELDEEPGGKDLERDLKRLQYGATVPVAFVGGQLVGSVDRVLASHINGSLVPLLKEAGALWL